MINVLPAQPSDASAIRSVTIAAFEQSEFGHSGEADLVEQLRNDHPQAVAEFVAFEQDSIVGHILFSEVVLKTKSQKLVGMGLGPMAINPDRQRQGIGTALIQRGLHECQERGCSFVVVLGHPDYYPRFGFRPAAEWQVAHAFAGIPQEFLFLLPLDQSAAIPAGKIFYGHAFGPQE